MIRKVMLQLNWSIPKLIMLRQIWDDKKTFHYLNVSKCFSPRQGSENWTYATLPMLVITKSLFPLAFGSKHHDLISHFNVVHNKLKPKKCKSLASSRCH